MNNLNFTAFEMLSKDQMKKVTGGMGCGMTGWGGQDLGLVHCEGDACSCQDHMDQQCEYFDACDDIDCGCK